MILKNQMLRCALGLGAAALAFASGAEAQTKFCQTINLRSGQVGGLPGLPGQADDTIKRHPTIENTGQPITNAAFTAANWFLPAQSGPPAFVINPVSPPWINSLPCDPLARWINWEIDPFFAGSALYTMPFDIQPSCIQKVYLDICWAVDDSLGDPYTGDPNPVGLYINGAATTPVVSGGAYTPHTTMNGIDITSLVTSGQNWISLYQRDAGVSVSGLIFSATIRVECCCEQITFRSGQSGGVPGLPGQLDDIVNRHPTVISSGLPLSNSPFNAGTWFNPAQTGPKAYVINSISPPWDPTLACDPLARWINWDQSPFNAASVLYAVPINVTSSSILGGTLNLCWAQDDILGDPTGWGGANAMGVYLNGTALPISGGLYTQSTISNINLNGILQPGTNWLYFYQRDLGVSVSGLIFSGTIDVKCGNPCPDPNPCYADCDGDGVLSIDDFICFQTYFALGC